MRGKRSWRHREAGARSEVEAEGGGGGREGDPFMLL